MKIATCLFGVTLLFATSAHGQMSMHALENIGRFGSFLTVNQTDEWIFDGEAGETIIAHVETKEFDPILSLGKKIDKKEDEILFEVDDEGGESRFAFRLPEKGRFAIRINAFKHQGGGNYGLTVNRFVAKPLELGKSFAGAFDRTGKCYYFIKAAKGQILVPSLRGITFENVDVLDSKGKTIADWEGSVRIESAGEIYFSVNGAPGNRYEFAFSEAKIKNLEMGKEIAAQVGRGEMEVWSFAAKPGDFRLLELDETQRLATRILAAPTEVSKEKRITSVNELREIDYLPVPSRGHKQRFALILGREGEYQFQMLAHSSTRYKLKLTDPRIPIEFGKAAKGTLPVGGAMFYRFKAAPGQLFKVSLGSDNFVPIIRMYDSRGGRIGGDATIEEADESLEERLTNSLSHISNDEETFVLQVNSLGDGGGGEFQLSLNEAAKKELKLGSPGKSSIQSGDKEYWAFEGKEGQTVFLHIKAERFSPILSIQSPDGIQLKGMSADSSAAEILQAIPLSKTGRHTISISSRQGGGEYTLRLLSAE